MYEKNIKKRIFAPIPVISIGNITFGGSEKTPLSIKLIKILLKKNRKPALISRGYKGKWEKFGGKVLPQNNHMPDWKKIGDEPYMMFKNIPEIGIFLGKNRISSCINAYKKGYDVAVMDDGFQYLSLKKDLEIVLHDVSKKALLRESESALKKAHLILLKKTHLKNKKVQFKSRLSHIPIYEYQVFSKGLVKIGDSQVIASEKFKQNKVLAFCGIAHPHRFVKTLKEEGIRPAAFLEFPDHYEYPLSAVKKIINKHKSINSDAIVTTEKDAVKLEKKNQLKDLPFYYLKIDLYIEPGFFEEVFSKLNSPDPFIKKRQ